MTEGRNSSWANILSRAQRSGPGPDNVVPLRRPTLDELEREMIAAQNRVIELGAAAERAALAYNTAVDALGQVRQRFAERLKETGRKRRSRLSFR